MKKKTLALQLLFVFFSLLSVTNAIANNIQVSAPTFTGYNSSSQVVNIACSVSWDNSWRNATNHDAAWLFVKYRINKGEWQHATLNSNVGSYVVPAGASLSTVADGGGVFVYRSSNATNSLFSVSNLQLSWPYGANGVPNNANLEVKVFALEMVHVPQAAFYLGNGSTQSTNSFFVAGFSAIPYHVTSDSLIVVDNVAPPLAWQNSLGVTKSLWGGGLMGNAQAAGPDSIPSVFPKGFSAFYCMKYEITQSAYVDFLNTLSYTQQANHTIVAPSLAAGTAALITNNATRNGIDIMTPGINPNKPAEYACNLDGDNNFNENNDGAFVGCNGLAWFDVAAYLDWAALRPMTEFEYEKASRGTAYPVNSEYAWGNDTLSTNNYGLSGLDSSGTPNERVKSSNYNLLGNAALSNTMVSIQAPFRVGIFSDHPTNNNNRSASGASFYGIMDLTGNIMERCVTINYLPRNFNGSHGDGLLTSDGYADASSWPGNDGVGIGYRGGSYFIAKSVGRISSRAMVSPAVSIRVQHTGGRGVRTAP